MYVDMHFTYGLVKEMLMKLDTGVSGVLSEAHSSKFKNFFKKSSWFESNRNICES